MGDAMNENRTDGTRVIDPVYLSSGTILHAKYRVNGVIGQGGFGITYDGTDLNLDMHVAIKEYFPNMMANRHATVSTEVLCYSNTQDMYEQGMKNFLNEAKNMAKYAGEENFVTVHDYFTENNTAYIIMEFVEGITLKQYLKEHGKLSMDDVMPIVIPIMGALEKIHNKGMIHRDVSPSNIMVLPDGRVRLLDFGAVKEVSQHTQNLTAMSSVYKYGYSPIEQQTMGLRQGPYTDIYALCATIYEMLTGKVPPSALTRSVEGDSLVPPSKLGVEIEPEQEKVLLRGLAINGGDRVQSIDELRNGLCGIKAGSEENIGGNAAAFRKAESVPGDGGSSAGGEKRGDKKGILIAVAVVALGVIAAAMFLRKPSTADKPAAQDSVQADAQEETNETLPAQEAEDEKPVEETAAEESQEEEAAAEESQEEETEEFDHNIPVDAISYNGHHYYFYNDVETNLTEAMDRCRDRGGYLAVINDREENNMLFEKMVDLGYEAAFFGLTDSVEEGVWGYLGADTSDFRDWGRNSKGVQEPNDADYGEDHAMLDVHMLDGHWNDAQFGKMTVTPEGKKYGNTHVYICEWDH